MNIHTLGSRLAAPLAVCLALAMTARAQSLDLSPQEQQRLVELLARAASLEVRNMTADELAELYHLEGRFDAGGSRLFFGQAAWTWASLRSLSAGEAKDMLVDAYRRKYGSDGPAALLDASLSDLPAAGSEVHRPPAYAPTRLRDLTRRPPVVAQPPFGPNLWSGISRLSTGERRLVPRR